MSKKSDRIKNEIAQTKADLATKLESLEDTLRADVGMAKESLEGAIENVKATARFFSLTHQVQERPLLMVGGAMLSGIVFTRWLVGGSATQRAPLRTDPSHRQAARPVSVPLLRAVAQNYPDEVRMIKSMAISFLINFIAEKAKANLPHLMDTVGEFEQRLKTELNKKQPS